MTELRSHTLARVAYERVTARKEAPFKKEYGALAHKFPGTILQNGLAQATGFLLAKGAATDKLGRLKDPEHYALLDDLLALLRTLGASHAMDRTQLHEQIIAADLATTLLLTRRALEASSWMKRYVQGALGINTTGDENEPEGANEPEEVGP